VKGQARRLDVAAALWRRRWTVIPLPLLGLAASLVVFSQMTSIYRGQATITFVPQAISESIYQERDGVEHGREVAIRQQLASTVFLEAAAAGLGPGSASPARLRQLARSIEVREVDPETFFVHYFDPDPEEAARGATHVARSFVNLTRERKVDEVEDSAAFLKEEVERLTQELSVSKGRLAQFQAAHRGELPTDRETHRAEQAFLRNRIADIEARIEAKTRDRQQRLDLIGDGKRAVRGGERPLLPEPAPDPRLRQIELLENELAAARLRYTDRHPQVVKLQSSLEAVRDDIRRRPYEPASGIPAPDAGPSATDPDDSLKRFVTLEVSRLATEIQELEAERSKALARVTRLEDQIAASYTREGEIGQMTAQISLLEQRLLEDQGRLQNLETERKIYQRGMDERYELKAEAKVPVLPFSPDLLQLLLIGVGAGAAAGIGLALLRELLDRTVHSVEEVEDLLETHVLAAIPDMDRLGPTTTEPGRWQRLAGGRRA
jgi:uncharacterized protein involved in exopolysaccharide biosynthesis